MITAIYENSENDGIEFTFEDNIEPPETMYYRPGVVISDKQRIADSSITFLQEIEGQKYKVLKLCKIGKKNDNKDL